MPNVAAAGPLVARGNDQGRTILPKLAAARDVVLSRGWLSKMPPSFQQRVIDECLYRRVKGGTVICRPGEQSADMYALVTGSLSLEIAPRGQVPHLSNFLVPGSWWGEGAALTGRKRRFGITAVRDSGLMILSARGVRAIIDDTPDAWQCFYLLTLHHLDEAVSLYDDLMRRKHEERFVAMLLHFSDCRHETPRHGGPIEVDVAQEELASIANVARTTASKVLRNLEKTGKIELSYRRIRILSPDGLRSMIRG